MTKTKQNPGVRAGASQVRHFQNVAFTMYSTAVTGANACMPMWPALIDGARMVEALFRGGQA
jgi:hypothetical protein